MSLERTSSLRARSAHNYVGLAQENPHENEARDRAQGLKILVGKDFALAKKIKADGVHFSDFDKLPLQFLKKKSFPKKFIFSFSSHNFKSALKTKANMIFISPIFPTTSHAEAKSLGLKNLAKIAFKSKNPNYLTRSVYALGGVNSKNIKSLRKLKISGFGAIDFFKENI
jgi:thiamine-phosphate pyrophosphorylase